MTTKQGQGSRPATSAPACPPAGRRRCHPVAYACRAFISLVHRDPSQCSMMLLPAKAAVGFGEGRLLAAARSAQRRISSLSTSGRARSLGRSTRWAPPPTSSPRRLGEWQPPLGVRPLLLAPGPACSAAYHGSSPFFLALPIADNLLQHYRRAMELEVDFFRQAGRVARLLLACCLLPQPPCCCRNHAAFLSLARPACIVKSTCQPVCTSPQRASP